MAVFRNKYFGGENGRSKLLTTRHGGNNNFIHKGG